MKKYKFEVVVTEGMDEFWEDIERRGVTGCDDVLELLSNCLAQYGLDDDVKLKEFTDK